MQFAELKNRPKVHNPLFGFLKAPQQNNTFDRVDCKSYTQISCKQSTSSEISVKLFNFLKDQSLIIYS